MFRVLRCFLGLILALSLGACAGFKKFEPVQTSRDYTFKNRAVSESQEGITLTVAVPSPDETQAIFGTPLEKRDMQPVWVRVQNDSPEEVLLLPGSLDPEYFSPHEAAYKSRYDYSKSARVERNQYFNDRSMDLHIDSGETAEGFIFTHLDRDRKNISLELLGEDSSTLFSFLIPVPGFQADYKKVEFDQIYQGRNLPSYDLAGLRKALEALPCCTFVKGEPRGDAVNLVVVGHKDEVLAAFTRSGWKETEAMSKRVALKVLKAYMSRRGKYKYAPMSDLTFFDRKQDVGLQKPRDTVHERNHLRLWLAPFQYQGIPVWVGAISRDIGITYTLKSPFFFITHKVDPDVDETREYLAQDFYRARVLDQVAWVKGVGRVPADQPRKDPMGNPWFTDGLRLVIFVSEDPKEIAQIEFLDWEEPAPR